MLFHLHSPGARPETAEGKWAWALPTWSPQPMAGQRHTNSLFKVKAKRLPEGGNNDLFPGRAREGGGLEVFPQSRTAWAVF